MLRYFFSGHVLPTHQSYSGTEDFQAVPEIHEILQKITDKIGCKESELQLNSVSFLGEVPVKGNMCSSDGCLNRSIDGLRSCGPCAEAFIQGMAAARPNQSSSTLAQKTKELEDIKTDLRILYTSLNDIHPISHIRKMIKIILKEDSDSNQSRDIATGTGELPNVKKAQ